MPLKADPNSKKSQVVAYFKENPNAQPNEVADLFSIKLGTVYTYKSVAANGEPARKPKKDKVVTAPYSDVEPLSLFDRYPYVGHDELPPQPKWKLEECMPHDQFVGYLRGTVIDLVSDSAFQGSNTTDLLRAQAHLNKLIEVL